MNFNEIEDAVHARLEPLTDASSPTSPNYMLRYLPDTEEEYDAEYETGKRGRITVLVLESKPDEKPNSTDPIIQDDWVTIQINTETRSARGDNGAGVLIKLIKKRLIGYRCQKFQRLVYGGFERIAYDSNRFQFAVYFRGKTVAVQDDDPETFPTLTEVSFDTNISTPGEEIIIPGDDFPMPYWPNPLTVGDMAVWDGDQWNRLEIGAAGTVLTSNGPGELPSWQ